MRRAAQYETLALKQDAAAARGGGEPPITSPASAFWQAEEARLRGDPGYEAAVRANSTWPVRTLGEMGRAQECFRRGEGYLYLMHMRKAGGAYVSIGVFVKYGCGLVLVD